MGTLSKLNPNIRAARTRRAVAANEVARGARHFTGHDRLALTSLSVLLEEIRNDDSLNSKQKDAKFCALMRREDAKSTNRPLR